MQLGIFGLGRMGMQIAKRLHQNNFDVRAWNRSVEPREEFEKFGGKVFEHPQGVIDSISDNPRIFWVMLPHAILDEFLFGIDGIVKYLKSGDILIDGGNSYFKDTVRRAQQLNNLGIIFYDIGTSGGVWGLERGFALMAGGPKDHWNQIEPIVKTLSSGENYGLLGKNGAGHFVKMVHNGIEYGMMEAIAEGYAIMQASEFQPDLRLVSQIYQKGSVVSSWLIDLTRNIFEHENIDATSGLIESTGEGEWTIKTAEELGVDARVIKDSFEVRKESKDLKNQNKFSNKIVALLRKQFGGHAISKQ
jgi:6-phosphogluconate dehydrogenase